MDELVEIGGIITGPRSAYTITIPKSDATLNSDITRERVQPIIRAFAKNLPEKKRQSLLEEITANTILLNGLNGNAQLFLNRHLGVYSKANNKIYIDRNYVDTPSLIEHEAAHYLGEKYVMKLPFPQRVITHHPIAANMITGYLNQNASSGEARKEDFIRMTCFKRLVPLEFHEMSQSLRESCRRIGKYARERNLGLEYLASLTR